VGSGTLRLASRFRPRGAIVLMYHSVLDAPQEHADSIGVSNTHATSTFRKQMEIIARNYNPVTLDDIRMFLSGEKKMPRSPIAVTFDDGYADNFAVAAPVLERVGVRAAFYLTVDAIETGKPPWFCYLRQAFATTKRRSWSDPAGQSWELDDPAQRESALATASGHLTCLVGNAQQEALRAMERDLDAEPFSPKRRLMMTWEEARRLSRDGHVVGSHTLTHPNLAHIGNGDLIRELTESRSRMKKELGMPIDHFSYPAAALPVSWTEHTVAASRQAGYRTAVTTTAGLVGRHDDPLRLRRVFPTHDVQRFRWNLEWAFLGLYR
jgi:peptidoglycan/xylan/chitin deacetylase (PgdA/CDA1 family)